MATESPLCLVTPRDRDLFRALDHNPLTVRQLLKLSATFAYPFTTARRVQERLRTLAAAGRVRQWRYATAGQGALGYYTLTRLGHRILHGHEALPAKRGHFGPVGVARQAHTQGLAEALVHLLVAAHAAAMPVENVRRENAVRLSVGEEHLYPDGAFELVPEPGLRFSYFLEFDNRTEPVVRTSSVQDSWNRKVQIYEKYQDANPARFRVLVVTTGGAERLDHMLECAAGHARNPQRSLVYGIAWRELLDVSEALTSPCFRNHMGQTVALVPLRPESSDDVFSDSGKSAPVLLASAACLRPLAEV